MRHAIEAAGSQVGPNLDAAPDPQRGSLSLAERLVVAVDVADSDQAKALIDQLADLGPIFKFGFHTLFGGGLDLARDLARQGHKVFLDAKLHDIPQTVEGGVRALARQGFWCLTAHGLSQNIAAAVAGAAGTDLKILGVTVLTSMGARDLHRDGITRSVADQVRVRAAQTLQAGAHGLIVSPLEVAGLRAECGDGPLLITPGIRPPGSDQGDQRRVATPGEAIAAGADALVVGRPILAASDPLDAAKTLLDQIQSALNSRS